MSRRSLLVWCVCLCFTTNGISGDDNQENPRQKLETAIPHAIELMEQKKFKDFMEQFVPPKHIEMMKATGMFATIVEKFGEGDKAQRLLNVLKEIKDTPPNYNAEKTIATYKLKEAVGNKDKIVFAKLDGYWYIEN